MAGKIDAVLFDFGGVFTESPFEAVERAGRELGAEPGQLGDILFGPYHEDTDHPWHRLERGELSLVDARLELIELGRRSGFDIDPFELLGGTVRQGGAREIFVECARSLRRRGYRTAMVTNNVRELREAWRRLIPVDELFERVIDSSEVGVRKPDPEIYRIALRELGGVEPDRSAFVDDYESNVEAARKLGIHGVLVGDDLERAIRDLEQLL